MQPAQKPPKKVREYHLRQWYVLADLLDRAGDTMGATRWFREVLAHDPDFADARERRLRAARPLTVPAAARARRSRASLPSASMAKPHFRAGVVAVVRRSDGQVMAFERADCAGRMAAARRAASSRARHPSRRRGGSSGRRPASTERDVRLVEQPPHWTVYEWPADMRTSDRIGQAHRWFFFEPLDDDIVPRPDGSEFTDWRWMAVRRI